MDPVPPASFNAFSIGVISSLCASLVVLGLTHTDEIRYLFISRRRYSHFNGEWHQYHLTSDAQQSPPVFWMGHRAQLKVTSFGRVRGRTLLSSGTVDYRMDGTIRQNVMRLRLSNQTAQEVTVSVTYPRLFSRNLLVGVWIGHDFDEHMSAGPILLSRAQLDPTVLTRAVRSERILRVAADEQIHPLVEPS